MRQGIEEKGTKMTTKQPDVRFIPCHAFGGGWLEPLTDEGRDGCLDVLEDEPAFFAPIATEGYIVEPYEVADVVTALRERDLEVTL